MVKKVGFISNTRFHITGISSVVIGEGGGGREGKQETVYTLKIQIDVLANTLVTTVA